MTQTMMTQMKISYGQTDRKVLLLTDPLLKMTYDEWVSIGGFKKHQGTYTIKFNKK